MRFLEPKYMLVYAEDPCPVFRLLHADGSRCDELAELLRPEPGGQGMVAVITELGATQFQEQFANMGSADVLLPAVIVHGKVLIAHDELVSLRSAEQLYTLVRARADLHLEKLIKRFQARVKANRKRIQKRFEA